MSQPYGVWTVRIGDKSQIEQMGTKPKFWVFNDEGTEQFLFKYNRPNTGEDWSEKIAAEIAELIGLPHAIVELAQCEAERGVVSKDFTEMGAKGSLVHGNELLVVIDSDYPSNQFRKVSQHSIDNLVKALSRKYIRLPDSHSFPSGIGNSVDLFLGYLMLDAFVGNTDRHHENWGILFRTGESEGEFYTELAPSFDHASSLGRELTEPRREALLAGGGGQSTVAMYGRRARSAIYLRTGDKEPLLTLDAFSRFSEYATNARKIWLDILKGLSEDSLRECVERVPPDILSRSSAEFVYQLLLFNRERLLNL